LEAAFGSWHHHEIITRVGILASVNEWNNVLKRAGFQFFCDAEFSVCSIRRR